VNKFLNSGARGTSEQRNKHPGKKETQGEEAKENCLMSSWKGEESEKEEVNKGKRDDTKFAIRKEKHKRGGVSGKDTEKKGGRKIQAPSVQFPREKTMVTESTTNKKSGRSTRGVRDPKDGLKRKKR